MVIGYDDPDEVENVQVRPAWSKPKDDLDVSVLRAVGRKYFKNPQERKAWRAFRDKTQGANEEDILFDAWIKHNVKLCADVNQKRLTRTFAVLLKMIGNEERRVDWQAANREKVMKSRKAAAIGAVTDSYFTEEDDA